MLQTCINRWLKTDLNRIEIHFTQIKENYGPNLDELQIGHVIGIMVDEESNLRLFFNGVDQGVAARDVPGSCYGLVDLYGICDKVGRQENWVGDQMGIFIVACCVYHFFFFQNYQTKICKLDNCKQPSA